MPIELTVITVVKNGLEDLKKTYKSLACQEYQDFKWLVMDGLSADGTLEWLGAVKGLRIQLISGKDKSIYNAMNKALGMVEKGYCLFLNAGDSLHDDLVLSRVTQTLQAHNPLLAYGQCIIQSSPGFPARLRGRHFGDRADLFLGRIPCHQATFIDIQSVKTVGLFNEEMKVYSDREWLMRFTSNYPIEKTLFIDFPIVEYDPSGYSYRNYFKTVPEYLRMIFAHGNPLEIGFGLAEFAKMTAYICISRVARRMRGLSSKILGRMHTAAREGV